MKGVSCSKFTPWVKNPLKDVGFCSKVASELGLGPYSRVPSAQLLGLRAVGAGGFRLTSLCTVPPAESKPNIVWSSGWHPMRKTPANSKF